MHVLIILLPLRMYITQHQCLMALLSPDYSSIILKSNVHRWSCWSMILHDNYNLCRLHYLHLHISRCSNVILFWLRSVEQLSHIAELTDEQGRAEFLPNDRTTICFFKFLIFIVAFDKHLSCFVTRYFDQIINVYQKKNLDSI